MKNKKRWLALGLVGIMTLGCFAGCGSKSDGKSADGKGDSSKGSVYYLNFKPEQDEQWQQLAKDYTKETGVDVTVVTAASGNYETTLMSEMGKSGAPTLFQVNGPVGLANWKDYCYDLSDSDIYKELVLLKLDNSQLNMQSAYEIFSRLMNIEPNHALDTFKYNISDISISKKILKLRKTKRFVIGIQYQSDTVDINGNRVKDWSKENIKLFLEMCKQEQIGVVNLVPITDKDITWDINADQVSIWNLLEVIAAVDCVVCIDSVCGHIAGLVGTNNLLLWSSQSYYQPTIYAYRPLRCNYTIYTSTRLSDIPPKLIFDRLKEILIGKLVLQKERFTMHGIDPNQYAINTEQFCVENEKQEKEQNF